MDFLGQALYMTAKVARDRMDARLATEGSSLPEWHALVTLEREPDLSQRDLAERMGIMGPTLSHHLERLESEGLIVRRRDEHDRRLVRVRLTAAGNRRLRDLHGVVLAYDAELNDLLSEREATSLLRLLTKLHGRLALEEGGHRGS